MIGHCGDKGDDGVREAKAHRNQIRVADWGQLHQPIDPPAHLLDDAPVPERIQIPGTPYLITVKTRAFDFYKIMARIARAVAPGIPHHVAQQGNRRQQTFFNDEDYQSYLELMSEWCMKFQVETWAYCLKPNHIHLIVVPETKDGLNLAIGEAHRRYTRRINFREGWRGPRFG
jgi:REP element-mobilizing transposase RayT